MVVVVVLMVLLLIAMFSFSIVKLSLACCSLFCSFLVFGGKSSVFVQLELIGIGDVVHRKRECPRAKHSETWRDIRNPVARRSSRVQSRRPSIADVSPSNELCMLEQASICRWSLCWEKETMHDPAPVRNFSLPQERGTTEKDCGGGYGLLRFYRDCQQCFPNDFLLAVVVYTCLFSVMM